MNRYERWNLLLELVAEAGRLDVSETARKLGVSSATIRRDFDELADQQLLSRTRGGVIAHSVSYDLPQRYKVAQHAPDNQRIASAAAALVPVGATIGLNGGTTTTEVARVLANRPDPPSGRRGPAFTLVTNALNIAHELAVRPHLHVVTTGGSARAESYELVGPVATGMLADVALDVAVLGVDALDVRHGASAHGEGEAAVNRLMAAKARQVIVVADSSKLGRRAFALVCPLNQINILVTDSAAPAELTAGFEDAGIRVIRV
ncbi:DeoR/GlpR family DNA-binding transcription regulator [Nonomuraea sp. NPDC026600]|uniref:DeoR/GlpR family DNA-binding transcription regulator n=1 Tax=Nonomuraea sp. NPDC026600 TaxID=3155363 RepID=UPI003410FD21